MQSWNSWDPMQDKTPPSATALRRLNVEIKNSVKETTEGIHFVLDDSQTNCVHALIVGPKDTPYEGGLFYFFIRIPSDYPFKPPMVKLMTTGNGSVRFNPNLYNDGKVCLSILGTWEGPGWTPSFTIKSVLLSIQSLLCEEPYFNEPGYCKSQRGAKEESKKYNDNIRFETLRAAVLDMMENGSGGSQNMPTTLKETMKTIFEKNKSLYATLLKNNKDNAKYLKLQQRYNKLIGVADKDKKTKENEPVAKRTRGRRSS